MSVPGAVAAVGSRSFNRFIKLNETTHVVAAVGFAFVSMACNTVNVTRHIYSLQVLVAQLA